MHTRLIQGVSLAALVFAAAPAMAQDAKTTTTVPAADESANSAGDIVVTAQRRSERLLDVPVAVTALSGDALQRLGAQNVSKVELATPGFTWGSQGSDSFPAIRGVRTSLVSAQTDPVIGFYLDGVYQSRTQQQSIPLFDIARVEVLRGPQGTLYGRNTFGGNISVVTSDPTDEFAAGVNLDRGNFDSARIDGFVNIPVSDTLQVRVAGVFQRHDGYVKSTTPGIVLNDLNENAQRVSLKWKPDDRLEVTIHAGTWRRDDAGAGSYGYKTAGTLINTSTGYQSINGSGVAVNPSVPNGSPNLAGRDVGTPVTGGAWTNDWDYQPFEHVAEDYVSGKIAYDLGFATVSSITGYTHFTAHRSADNDQSSKVFEAYGYGSGIQEPKTRSKAFSQEVQLASNSRTPLEWIVGAYYLKDDIFETYQQKVTAPGATTNGFRADSDIGVEALAFYGQASYAIVPDKLKLIGGIRYSHEKKSFVFSDFADAPPNTYDFTTPYVVTSGSPSFNSWTWRAGLQYTVDRNTMIYATASTGFASGGVNDSGGNPLIPQSYAPQKVDAYEAGFKSRILGGLGQFEASVFYNKFSNLQINIYTPLVSYFGSAGKARSYGAEMALRLNPVQALHIDATAAMMNAEYTSYISGNNFYGLSDGTDPVSLNLKGNRIPQSPKLKTTLAVSYDIDLGTAGMLSPMGSWLHSSSYYTTDRNTVLDRQGSYDKFDASLRWSSPDDRTYVEAYGDNLSNQAVLLSGVIGRRQRIQVSYAAPRTYGIRVGTKF